MLNFLNLISIKNKVLFGFILVMLLSLGIGIIEFNRIVKMDYIFKEGLILETYRTNFFKLTNIYNKLGISSLEIMNTDNQKDYVKEVNKIKNLQIEITNIFNNLESIDFSKTKDDFLINNVTSLNDSIFVYNRIYTDKIKITINQLIEFKYLTLHPEQIDEDYKSLLVEQQNLGVLSVEYSNRTKEEIVLELIQIYDKSIYNFKYFLLKSLNNQEFLFDKITFGLQKQIDKNNNEIASVRRNIIKISIFLLLISLVLIILISFIIANSISKPIIETNNILEKISKGTIPDNIDTDRADEIGIVIESVNKLTTHLRQTVKFSHEISAGNFKYEYLPAGNDDILGNSLIQLRESLIHANKEEEKRKLDDLRRNRENDGISIFSDILRQNQNNLKKLGKEVISNLVKFLKANQGVIFVLDTDEDEPFLNLISAYAWNREKFIDKRIALGDGLIGSVAIEKFTVYMTDVPEDYIEIKSGTGSANPKSILLVPLKVDEEVLGVIEIASFNEFEQYEIEIVEHIAENIASTLKSVRISDQTSELLEKFQIQASEMKEQEMALKESIDELQKAHHERKNREEELSKKLKEINELNKQIQFKDDQLQKEISGLVKEKEYNLEKIETQKKNIFEIINKMFISVLIVKNTGVIEYANKISENLFGFEQVNLIGKKIEEIILLPEEIKDIMLYDFLLKNFKKIEKNGGNEFFIQTKNNKNIKVLLDLIVTGTEGEQSLIVFLRNEKKDMVQVNQNNEQLNNVLQKDIEKTLRIEYYENYFNENKLVVPEFKLDTKEIIKWGSKYELGVSLIDNQHKKWIHFINKFFADLILFKEEKELSNTLKELKEYTDYHFSFEEKYLTEFKYPDLANHLLEHKKFIETLDNYYKQFARGDISSIHQIILYLKDWVDNHVIDTDAKYIELFKKHGIK